MARTVRLAAQHGVAIGAHPSYPDLVGFGRRAMELTAEEVAADVTYQVGALWAFCRAEGVPLNHVKAHGALYNKAAVDVATAKAIAQAIKKVDTALIMVCLSNSAMVEAARECGVAYVEEAFADRAYTREGNLVARSKPGGYCTIQPSSPSVCCAWFANKSLSPLMAMRSRCNRRPSVCMATRQAPMKCSWPSVNG